MEKILSIIFSLLISTFLNPDYTYAQTVNSSGNTIINEHFEVTYSLGETFNSISAGATEGFLVGYKIVIEEITNIKSLENFQISVYPNPSSDFINLETKEFNRNLKVLLFDINGIQNIQSTSFNSEGKIQIPVQNLITGIYFIKIIDEQAPEKTQIFKIIKK